MGDQTSASRSWTPIWRRLAFYGTSNIVSLTVVWVWVLQVASLAVVGPLLGLHALLFFVAVNREFAGLRRWERDSAAAFANAELLTLDDALQRGPGRLGYVYAGTMITALFVAMVVAWLGWSGDQAFGVAEWLTGGSLLVAMALGSGPVLHGLLDSALVDARATVGTELERRDLVQRRLERSFIGTTTTLNVGYCLALFYGVGSIGAMLVVRGQRDTATLELRLALERSAEARRRDPVGTPLESGAEIVLAEQLPAALVDPSLAPTISRADLDVRAGRVHAAVALDPGGRRWLVDSAAVDERLGYIAAFFLLAPLFFALTLAWVNTSMSQALAHQMSQIREATKRVLEAGQISGIPRSAPATNDEIGMLVRDFNGLLDVLEDLAAVAHEVAAGKLDVEFTRGGDLHDAFRGMLARLRNMVTELQGTTGNLANAATTLQALASEQQLVVEQQSKLVGEVSETVDLLTSASQDITSTAGAVLGNAEQTLATAATAVGRLELLDAEAGRISELLEVIREVANRSDILALNGALEASRAGEAGQGFALIAEEMRRLAERIAGTVADVRERVEGIERATAEVAASTRANRELAERTAHAARDISDITAAQNQDTERLSAAMSRVADSVGTTARATSRTRDAADSLLRQAEGLEQTTGDLSRGPS